MKNYFLTISLLFTFLVSAQSDTNVEEQQTSINFLLPGVVYEAGVSKNATVTGEFTIGFAYRESFNIDGFGIYPIGKLQYRHYYNFERRLKKGKRISGNTGNYIAPTFGIQGGNPIIGDLEFASNYSAGFGVVYGIQRTAPKGFQFRLEAGPGVFFNEFDTEFGINLSAKLGWVLGRRNKN